MSWFSESEFSRREFLAALAALGGHRALKSQILGATAAPRVTATPTIFFAPPDGRNALVRFVVEDSSAPAGRLRIFDHSHRQLGTAGVIGISGRLYGELWLPLDRETEIVSELEQPQTRGVLRTTHTLRPRRRWTVYWMTAEPGMVPAGAGPEFLDTEEFLGLASGVHPSSMMLDSSGLLEQVATAPLMLAGSGVRWVGLRDASVPLALMQSRDGSSVIAVALAEVGGATLLGGSGGRNEMARRLEQWLEGPGTQLADESHAISLMVGTDSGDAAALKDRISDWNSRFAFPRIVTDRPEELLAIIEKRAPTVKGGQGAQGGQGGKNRDNAARAARIFEPLVSRLEPGGAGLGVLARQFAFPVPATLVVNSTPFSQSGIAVMPDGIERLVTDVPALGYVCIPYNGAGSDAGRWIPIPGSDNDLTLDARHFQVRIDRETGAIRSLIAQASGREWVRRGSEINSATGFRLDALQKLRNTGLGTRLVATRRSSAGPPLTSSITIYEDLPWVDISNDRATDQGPASYGFAFALESPAASWEIPAGFDERPAGAEVSRLVHLRWLRLATGGDAVLLRGLDAPVASLTRDGAVVSQAPAPRSRYRLGFASGYSAADDAWRFGWGTEPLVTVPVPGTGNARLSSYGSLLLVDQAGASVVELRRDRAGDGVVLFVQELLGAARDITLGPGALTFRGARHIDFFERDLGDLPALSGGGVSVPLRAYGITAIRLTGVELAGA